MIEFPWMAIRPECKVQTSGAQAGTAGAATSPSISISFARAALDLDAMVTRRGRLGDINEAFRAMKAGEIARTVLTFD